jgi:hypothetical protein
VFENMVMGILYGSKSEGAVGGWKRLHSEKLHNLCSLPNIVSDKSGGVVQKARNMRSTADKCIHSF